MKSGYVLLRDRWAVQLSKEKDAADNQSRVRLWFACGVLGFDVFRSSVVFRLRKKVGHVRECGYLYIFRQRQ